MAPVVESATDHSFLADGGELCRLIALHEWSDTALGSIECWPAALKSTVALVLRSPLPIVTLWGEPGVMIYNDAYSEFAGPRHPGLLGRDVRNAWPEVADFNDEVIRTVFGAGRTMSFKGQELTLYREGRPDTAWLDLDYSPIVDEAGNRLGVIAIVVETTEAVLAERQRTAAQGAIAASENQFLTFAQSMPNQVWTAPADGQLDWFNARVFDYGGLDYDALKGDGWARMVHPDDLPAAAQSWGEALAAGTTYETEFRLRRRDGDDRWHLVRALPILGADGAISRWIGTNTDIHDQKLAEAQSVRDRDRLWALSQDLLLVCDFAGVISSVNPSATRLLGFSQDEMIGHNLAEFVHPDDVAATAAEIAKLTAGATTLAFENRYRTADGNYRLLDWTAVPEGDRIHAVGRDITEERAAAEALEASEAALRQSQKMEAVGQLTGGIAHDFNNLLQGITGSLEIIQRRVAQSRFDDLDRFITGATGAANRAAALTHRLLAFARRQPIDPRPVRVDPLLRSMEDLLRRTIGEGIRLELVAGPDAWLTRCDPNQLENAILNLVINARDAMPDGGRVTIETSNARLTDGTPGDFVLLAVSDTGVGMSEDVVARAFEPFFTTKPIGQGTGLGLSMIYGFARQSEGEIRIVSEEGCGTTIQLYLPRFTGPAEDDDVASSVAEQPGAEDGETILVVEDDPVVRDLLVELLGDLGYRILQAEDGARGVELLQSAARIDLLVTDIGLPGMNGRQVADAGRERRPGLRVLFMTGYAENAAHATGFLEPGMAMITKPFAIDVLTSRVRDILSAG